MEQNTHYPSNKGASISPIYGMWECIRQTCCCGISVSACAGSVATTTTAASTPKVAPRHFSHATAAAVICALLVLHANAGVLCMLCCLGGHVSVDGGTSGTPRAAQRCAGCAHHCCRRFTWQTMPCVELRAVLNGSALGCICVTLCCRQLCRGGRNTRREAFVMWASHSVVLQEIMPVNMQGRFVLRPHPTRLCSVTGNNRIQGVSRTQYVSY